MNLSSQCKRNLGLVISVFSILLIATGFFFLHYISISEERIKLLEERNSVLRMNNQILENADQLYQECQSIKDICKTSHPEVQGMAVME